MQKYHLYELLFSFLRETTEEDVNLLFITFSKLVKNRLKVTIPGEDAGQIMQLLYNQKSLNFPIRTMDF
ncbi:hypothetical protein SAMN05216391_11939 [Lachnospiraceae bacterium KHCPX20]|nr:hypothetical protein SAMN05216391_11939 [Lachnospiraceae bacterium KHCPX20]